MDKVDFSVFFKTTNDLFIEAQVQACSVYFSLRVTQIDHLFIL